MVNPEEIRQFQCTCGEVYDNEIDAEDCCPNYPEELDSIWKCENCEKKYDTEEEAEGCCKNEK